MEKMKINKNKAIGNVIYIVEGDKTEPEIIKHIFKDLFNYSVCLVNKKNEISLYNPQEKYSKVHIIVAKYPQIKKLEDSNDYFDNIYSMLSSNGLNVENSAIYYIFDRDRECNRSKIIENDLKKYYNSRDNGNEMNGLFLLSYPSIEAFLCNSNLDNTKLSDGKMAKEYTKKYIIDKVEEKNLMNAVNIFLNVYKKILQQNFSANNLDNFSDDNLNVFKFEEETYCRENTYHTLSLLILSLIDLGIIEI